MIYAVVPARSGSKGFPNKNVAVIGGKTLIEYAVEAGTNSSLIDKVLISSDSQEYVEIALNVGAVSYGLRPVGLSNDIAKTVDVILNLLERPELQGVSHIVLLQPTSPIRDSNVIDQCIKIAVESGESAVTVAKINDPHPAKMKKIKGGILCPLLDGANSEVPRQQLPEVFELTGGVYVSSVENLMRRKSFFSENTRPIVCKDFVNIDSERDYQFLKFLFENRFIDL